MRGLLIVLVISVILLGGCAAFTTPPAPVEKPPPKPTPTPPTPTQCVLQTVVDPPGGGSVNPSSGTYSSDTTITLTATPSPGYWFISWSGDVPEDIRMSSFIFLHMDRERTLRANFELIPTPAPGPFVLQTVVDPPGGGSVNPSSGTYGRGTRVTLTATPSPGYRFVSWSGEVQSTSQTISTPMRCEWTLQANFELIPTPTIQGTKIQLQSPLYNERFVQGETVRFEAIVTCEPPCDGSQLQWTSDRDGHLGNGPLVSTSGLSLGTHTITVSGYGMSETFPVRVFAHLGDLYRAPPAEGEIQRILSHFTFVWENGSGSDEDWSAYDSFNFDQNSTNPSKVVIIAKLDVMRHQRFSEPLPMTNGKTIYDHLRTWVNTICLRLDCFGSSGGDGELSLHRTVSVWDARGSGGACKIPRTPLKFWPYVYQLQLFVHEGRHSEQGDPGHSDCGQGGPTGKDYQLEGGSGYAWGALYQMWVYKYSLYDPADIRNAAKQEATWFLHDRFCTTPSHSDPRVQAIIQELLGQ